IRGSSMKLTGDDIARWQRMILLHIITSINAVDVKRVKVSLHTNNVAIPSVFLEQMFQDAKVSANELTSAMFVINVAPESVSDVGLVADHVTVDDFGAIVT